jgi:hypothetical protein
MRPVLPLRIHACALLLLAVLHGCAPVGEMHSGGAPVTWSISTSDSPTGGSTVVCEGVQPQPCVLDRSTGERPSYASFVLHLWGPEPTTFTGSMFVGYLHDPDPTHYKSSVEVTSNGQDVHQRVFSRVTTVPGQYEVRVRLEETGTHLATPRTHEVSVPVTVR